MNRGGKLIGTAAMLSVAACGGQQGKLEIRPTPTPLAAGDQAVPVRIAEARGQLAIGNVALALEAFRIALREDPNSIEAMMGVAACYDRMARFDLSRRHYESALAIAPGNSQLLAAFAGSLDLQGRKAEAASVRSEIQQRAAMAAASIAPPPAATAIAGQASPAPPPRSPVAEAKPAQRSQALVAAVPSPRAVASPAVGRSVTVVLPPARPVAPRSLPAAPVVEKSAKSAPPPASRPTEEAAAPAPLPAPRPAEQVAAPAPLPAPRPAEQVAAPAPLPSPKPAEQVAARAPLPPVLPVAAPLRPAPAADKAIAVPTAPSAAAAPVVAPPVTPIAAPTAIARAEPVPEVAAPKAGPRLERTSLREVALITTAAPQWRPLTVKRTQRSATVRFVPLRQASINLSNIRLLNAARVNRLAARTRSYLVGRGWSPMAIGNAPAVRARSVIFYPPERRRTAQTLSAQFGFVMKPRPGSRQITVLLGQDAARVSALQARG